MATATTRKSANIGQPTKRVSLTEWKRLMRQRSVRAARAHAMEHEAILGDVEAQPKNRMKRA